jgi:hypothetical protein
LVDRPRGVVEPTNRTRIKRAVRSRVTDEARAIYADALALRGVRQDHIRGLCPTVGTHCPECLRYMDLRRELGRLLGVKFWEVSPLEADSEDPPVYIRNNPLQSGYWVKAWALKYEIGARAVLRRTKRKQTNAG